VEADGTVGAAIGSADPTAAIVGAREVDDVFPVNLTLPQRVPTRDCAASAETTLCLDIEEHRASGAARATRRGEPDGRMADCRSHWVQLTRS
jgi:hypothetical protein